MEGLFQWIYLTMIVGFYMATSIRGSINLSLKKPATQSTTLSTYTADRALDGNSGNSFFGDNSCSHTAHGQSEAWWQVNLLELCNIKGFSIHYRKNYTERFWGFHVYVSNSTDWSSGYLCHRHIGPDLPEEFTNISCSAIGQFVTISNFRNETRDIAMKLEPNAYMELCEVEVLGCPFGRFGNRCLNSCSEDCRQVNCDPDSGKCPHRCRDGFKGIRCDELCSYGSFGPRCRDRCYCMRGTCYALTGLCPTGGCQAGWRGKSCNKACAPFTFGPGCKFVCHCMNETCNRLTGRCQYGCVEGWVGIACNQECAKLNSTDDPRKTTITCLILVAVLLLIINILSCSIYFRNKIFSCKRRGLSYNLQISNPAYHIDKVATDDLDNTAVNGNRYDRSALGNSSN